MERKEFPFPSKEDFNEIQPGNLLVNQDTFNDFKADFGLLSVLENRNNPASEILYLPIVKVHSKDNNKLEPIFLFEGGPGLSNINFNYFPTWLLEKHDIIRVGYRGVDGSVSLAAPEINQTMKTLPYGLTVAGYKGIGKTISDVACRLQNEGIDVSQYTIHTVIGDMEDARKALGYEEVSLSGGSYGGAVVYAYCVNYPRHLNRALLTEAAFVFDLALGPPDKIQATLERLNRIWKSNPDCVHRSDDILNTIRSVLSTLPQNWHGIEITKDKMRLMLFFGLYSQTTTAQAFDAFIAAQKDDDYSGLAFMSLYWNQVVDMFNWGDMVAKTIPTRISTFEQINAILYPLNTLIGHPLAELGWGPVQYTNWPDDENRQAINTHQKSLVQALFIYGSQEAAEKPLQDYIPNFENANVMIYENLGHMDVGGIQSEAAHHLEAEFFASGIVDKSKFRTGDDTQVNFIPDVTFQELAKSMVTH